MKNATKITASIMGILAGLAGIEHGVGEILQGSVAPEAVVFQSWPNSAAMEIVNGEPAMSVLPNLLVTGVLAVLISLVFLAWVLFFIQRRHGGLVLMLICLPWLLFGGGFGPPLLGLILGASATKIHSSFGGWRAHVPGGVRRFLGGLWPWLLGACIAAWLVMMPGTVLINYFWGMNNAEVVFGLILAMFTLLFLTILAGYARDSQRPIAAR